MMKELFDNLMELCQTCDKMKFFYKDFTSPFGTKFRIFSYNFASYTDWCLDDALECRGIMFEIDENGPVRIASRPMEKFFNLNETPFTMNLDFSKVSLVTAKEDGSLISTFVDAGRLRVKSKGSIYSDQSDAALQWIYRSENDAFRERLLELAKDGYTANLEYVAPDNRIVLDYQEKALVLLNIRHNDTGEYVPYKELFKDGILRQYLVRGFDIDTSNPDFVNEIRKMEGIEGFIFEMEDGLKFKLKTEWYCALHHTKDSINNNERLFGSIVANASDDLKSMFAGDTYAFNKVEAFEKVYLTWLSQSLSTLVDLNNQLVGLDRKDFALKAQVALKEQPGLFSILMNAFQKGLDFDALPEQLGRVFMKNCKKHVPAEYSKEEIIFGE